MTVLPAFAGRTPSAAAAFAAAWLVVQFAAPAPASAQDRPPAAPIRNVPQTLHGTTVPDPYRDLEDVRSAATRQWLKEQGEYAERMLAAAPDRQALTARVEALTRATGDSVRRLTRMPGGRLFYLKRAAGQSQFRLVMRDGPAGAERVLVDPAAIAQERGVPHAVDYFSPSWDGRRVAYGLSAGGSEDASLYVLDVDSGKHVGAPIPRVPELERNGGVRWTPDNRYLAYTQLRDLPPGTAETETYLDSTVFLLRVGAPESEARPLFGAPVNRDLGLERLDVATLLFQPGSRWMVARTTDTTVPEGKIFVAPIADLHKPAIAWRQVVAFDDQVTDVALRAGTLYLRTHKEAPRGRWLALDLATGGDVKAARVAIAEPARGVLREIALGPKAIYGEVFEGFNSRVLRFDRPGAPGRDIAPGLEGSTFLLDHPGKTHDDLLIGAAAWTRPVRIMHATGPDRPAVDTRIARNQVPAGTPRLAVTEVLVRSHDGAEVPLAIVHRADLKRDGARPTLLSGYGAYGLSFEARYYAGEMAWLERGGVLAFANVRGSGAFGDPWHRAGYKATKPNTWKDGIACAKYLIERGYASPKTLAVQGGSAGGIFAGRVMTEAPELFAAAVLEVGLLDTIRAEETANGITNISEFGSVKNADEFRSLLDMSTYHRIRDGVDYPSVLLIHGMNDPRVEVWQSAKAAARLQAANPNGRPALLRLDAQAGHGIGSTARQTASKLADTYAFLLDQFGQRQAGDKH